MVDFFVDGVNDPINVSPSIAGIIDNFDALALNPSRWDLANSHAATDDGSRLNLDGTDSYIKSFGAWSLPVSAGVYVRAWPDLGSGGDSFFGINSTVGSFLEFRFTSPSLFFNCGSPAESHSITYDGVAHAWWRIRREGDQAAFYTAPMSANLISPGTWTRRFLTTLSPDFLEEQDFFVYAGATV